MLESLVVCAGAMLALASAAVLRATYQDARAAILRARWIDPD